MEQHIREIIKDIIQIDPTLLGREEEIGRIVRTLISLKPETDFSESFREELRLKIFEKISEMRSDTKERQLNVFSMIRSNMFVWKNGMAVASIFAVIVIVGGVYNYTRRSAFIPVFDTEQKIVGVGDESFGGFDTGAPIPQASQKMFGRGGGTVGIESMPLHIARSVERTVKFQYVGGAFPAPEEKMEVLRRAGEKSAPTDAFSALRRADFGFFNIGMFQKGNMDSFSVSENKEFGYTATVNVKEGTVAINQNWDMWPHYYECNTESCTPPPHLAPSDVPADEELVRIANEFVKTYDLSLENYGTPEADNSWKKDKSFIADALPVLYPLSIGKMSVYDEEGGKIGMGVGVDIRMKRVSSAWGMHTQVYEESLYPAETDMHKIIAFAERGGTGRIYEKLNSTGEIKLGTPELAYVMMTSAENGISRELYVPAYVFPMEDKDGILSGERVIVPLIKSFLEGE